MTDSEIVPRGKGEKEPITGSEKEHETVIWQAVGEACITRPWPRACRRMSRRLIGGGLVKKYNPKPKRKQVLRVSTLFRAFLLVTPYGPEPEWSNHGQDEAWVTPSEGPNSSILKNREMSYG